jgi:hypothetical protein
VSRITGDRARRREFITFLGSVALTRPLSAYAQQTQQIRRAGVLMPFDEQNAFGKEIVETLH